MPCLRSSTAVWRVSSQSTTSAARSSASTLSVTSSRFPIGVAQTASGTRRLLQRFPGHEAGADKTCGRAELGRHDVDEAAARLERFAHRDLARRLEEVAPR